MEGCFEQGQIPVIRIDYDDGMERIRRDQRHHITTLDYVLVGNRIAIPCHERECRARGCHFEVSSKKILIGGIGIGFEEGGKRLCFTPLSKLRC